VIDGQRRGDALQLRVIDDGVGFAGEMTGIGLQNTRQRLEQLYGDGQRFTIRNRPAGGAEVTIDLPYRTLPVEPSQGAACRA
jgi:two-component system LytT family sensor kinase